MGTNPILMSTHFDAVLKKNIKTMGIINKKSKDDIQNESAFLSEAHPQTAKSK